ncbi:hypothetical protein P4689_29580 [Priestia megaterium]|uniref:hypothetical protein n=1 Tax=Priestia megaterium TaxID=1404 RepID=UPI002E23BA22|nr:hypothetical protein [Priestia megaterium]
MQGNSIVRMSRTDRKKNKGKNKIRSIWESLRYISSCISTGINVLLWIVIALLVLGKVGTYAGQILFVLYQLVKAYGEIIIRHVIA